MSADWPLALALEQPSGFTWLDGGREGRSFVGVAPDRELRGDSLDVLGLLDDGWRSPSDDRAALWMGWATYDVGAARLLGRPPRPGPLAGVCVRRYRRGWRSSPEGQWHPAPPRLGPPPSAAWPFGPLVPGWAPADYRDRVARARARIAEGETYQVNLSQPFHASLLAGRAQVPAELAAAAYRRLREQFPAEMGALLECDGAWILSNSPETLLDVRPEPDGLVVRSWPIKGTRPRHPDPAEDAAAMEALVASEKDRAEHVMIVDLVRNDLGQLCRPGTVRASPKPSLVSLPTVHHLVTEVRGVLRPEVGLLELFEAVFPGGSITGAPKRRTVELIDELEQEARGIYCGAILVLEPGRLRVSIPIRTARLDTDGLYLRSGGGIVADSEPEDERLETLAKARAFQP